MSSELAEDKIVIGGTKAVNGGDKSTFNNQSNSVDGLDAK